MDDSTKMAATVKKVAAEEVNVTFEDKQKTHLHRIQVESQNWRKK